jgi:hypothetical protein
MLRTVKVSARFAFAQGATVTFSDTLEVSLDCCVCHRCWRTVIFQLGGIDGKCTPTSHSFPGKLVAKDVGREGLEAFVAYLIEYQFEPFEDVKYPDRIPAELPTWGRVGFEVICPRCGEVSWQSTQNNIVRPWTQKCKCGLPLFTETVEMPGLSLVEENA